MGLYGIGLYFATTCCHSLRYADDWHIGGVKFMDGIAVVLVAKVNVGGVTLELCHSTIDREPQFFCYCITIIEPVVIHMVNCIIYILLVCCEDDC